MSKQLLPLIFLTSFALASLVPRVLADPTEDADRQFLNNLEQHHASTAAPAARVPAATPTPAPIAKVTKSPSATRRDSTTQNTAEAAKTPKPSHQRVAQETAQKPAEVADRDPAPPVAGQRVIIVQSPDGKVDGDQAQDEDHEHQHHHFFHRLFSRLLGQQHPEDW